MTFDAIKGDSTRGLDGSKWGLPSHAEMHVGLHEKCPCCFTILTKIEICRKTKYKKN